MVDPGDLDAFGVDGFVVAVGDNAVRAAAIARVRAEHPGLELVNAVHPAAVVARDAVVGPGATLMAGAVIGNGCVAGAGLLMGTNSSIDHDNTVGDYASLAPGATTGGNVAIGAYTALGLGAKVIHEVAIGAHTVIGAGAVVLRDVPDHVVAFGLPAAVVRARAEGEPYLAPSARRLTSPAPRYATMDRCRQRGGSWWSGRGTWACRSRCAPRRWASTSSGSTSTGSGSTGSRRATRTWATSAPSGWPPPSRVAATTRRPTPATSPTSTSR